MQTQRRMVWNGVSVERAACLVALTRADAPASVDAMVGSVMDAATLKAEDVVVAVDAVAESVAPAAVVAVAAD